MADEMETTPCALMGEAMARYKHDELSAGEAVSIILEQAKRLSQAPMEAVAWRYRESADQDWTYEDHTPQHTPYRVGRMRRTVFPDFQALAVIPTEGLGSFSQAKTPTEGQSTSKSHIQTGAKNDRP